MKCKKIPYTEIGAKIALSKIAGMRRYKQHHKRKEARSYLCPCCGMYHLTSKRIY